MNDRPAEKHCQGRECVDPEGCACKCDKCMRTFIKACDAALRSTSVTLATPAQMACPKSHPTGGKCEVCGWDDPRGRASDDRSKADE